ncbi:MAG: helix-turn-helix transcriptional regulator [Lachnospiraceae bacterium]|nr:helix-turn-helix transcriptional regulator [Lachnospiraceae bacterium]
MSIGENIAHYRKAKGLKQSELGEQIGVSAQAVSKWENGGAPDVTLMPEIARALDVSIGMLFGESAETWQRQAAAELVGHDPEHAAERVCAFLWELQKEIGSALGFSDVLKDIDYVEDIQKQCHVRLCQDSGLWLSNIHRNFHYGLIMPEPADGFSSVLSSPEEYERVFAVLGKKDRCRVLIWLYGQSKPATLRRIEAQLNIPVKDALEDLAGLGFVQKLEIDTDTDSSLVYGPVPNYSQLPFLYFLNEFLHEDEISIINYTPRKKPLLNQENKNNL